MDIAMCERQSEGDIERQTERQLETDRETKYNSYETVLSIHNSSNVVH